MSYLVISESDKRDLIVQDALKLADRFCDKYKEQVKACIRKEHWLTADQSFNAALASVSRDYPELMDQMIHKFLNARSCPPTHRDAMYNFLLWKIYESAEEFNPLNNTFFIPFAKKLMSWEYSSEIKKEIYTISVGVGVGKMAAVYNAHISETEDELDDEASFARAKKEVVERYGEMTKAKMQTIESAALSMRNTRSLDSLSSNADGSLYDIIPAKEGKGFCDEEEDMTAKIMTEHGVTKEVDLGIILDLLEGSTPELSRIRSEILKDKTSVGKKKKKKKKKTSSLILACEHVVVKLRTNACDLDIAQAYKLIGKDCSHNTISSERARIKCAFNKFLKDHRIYNLSDLEYYVAEEIDLDLISYGLADDYERMHNDFHTASVERVERLIDYVTKISKGTIPRQIPMEDEHEDEELEEIRNDSQETSLQNKDKYVQPLLFG